MIRATSALVPPSVAYTVDDAVMFANAAMWPGDAAVIRLDRNMCDPRRSEVDRLLDLLLNTIGWAAERALLPNVASFIEKRLQARAKVPVGQTSMF